MPVTLNPQQRQALVSNHPFFAQLSPEKITELTRMMFEKEVSAGEIIVAQGELVDCIYFIAHGNAEVTRKMELQGKTETLLLATLMQNDVIGLAEHNYFAPGGIRTATVTATANTLLLGLKVDDFYQFLQTHPNFNRDTQAATELMIRMNFIKEVTSFVQLSLGRIRWLAQHLEKTAYQQGSVIFQQGQEGDKCYVIYSGQVEISLEDPIEGKKILATLKSPMMFGETALLTSAPRNATAIALEDCILFAIKRQNLLELAAMEDSTNHAIRALMVERSRPIRSANIQDYHHKTSDGQEIVTLKNPLNSHYYRLTKEGWFIWQQVNGINSLREISHKFTKYFSGVDASMVPTTIFNLANAGFIQIASLNINENITKSSWGNTKKWWATVIGLFILMAAYFGFIEFKDYQQQSASPIPNISIAPVVSMVLAIDLDNVGIDATKIRNGEVPILAIHTGPEANTHTLDTLSFINEFAQLVFFDSDKNGRIDMSDDSFARLELVFLSPNPAQIRHIPISMAGIRAIELNKPELIQFALDNQPDKFPSVNNAVIVANGSTRHMQVVPVEQNILR